MKVTLPPTREDVERRLARAVAAYIFVHFFVAGLGVILAPKIAALVTMLTGVLLSLGALQFETIKARRARRGVP